MAVGEAYEKHASCIKGIESVKRNCHAPTEDLTLEGGPKLPNPKYEIFNDATGKFRFHLKAANGEIIALGEGYESKEACLNGIDVVRNCTNAAVVDPFAVKKKTFEMPSEGKIVEAPKPQPLATLKTEPIIQPKEKIEAAIPEPQKAETAPAIPIPPVEEQPIPQLPTERVEAAVLELQKTTEPNRKIEELTTAVVTPTVEEPIQEVGPAETKLELYSAPQNINKGDKVTLLGRLFKTRTGEGIPDAKIRIYERDKSVLGDDYLAFGITGQDGSFSISWKARSLTWRKRTGNIYAKFNGHERAKPSQSAIQEITIK